MRIEKIHACRMFNILQIQNTIEADSRSLLSICQQNGVALSVLNAHLNGELLLEYRGQKNIFQKILELMTFHIHQFKHQSNKSNLKLNNFIMEEAHSSRIYCVTKIFDILARDKQMIENFVSNDVSEFDVHFNGEMLLHYGGAFIPIIELLNVNIKNENDSNLNIFSNEISSFEKNIKIPVKTKTGNNNQLKIYPTLKTPIKKEALSVKEVDELLKFFSDNRKKSAIKKTNKILNNTHNTSFNILTQTNENVSVSFGMFLSKDYFCGKYSIENGDGIDLEQFELLKIVENSIQSTSENLKNIPQYMGMIDDKQYKDKEFYCIETPLSKRKLGTNVCGKPKNHNIVKGEFCRNYDDMIFLWKEFAEYVKSNYKYIDISKFFITENFKIEVDKTFNYDIQLILNGNSPRFFIEQTKTNKIEIPINMIDDYSDFETFDIIKNDSKNIKMSKIFNCLNVEKEIVKSIINNFYEKNISEDTFDSVEFLKHLLKSKAYANILIHFKCYKNYYDGPKMFFKNFGSDAIRKSLGKAVSVEYCVEMGLLSFALQFFKCNCVASSLRNTYYDTSLLKQNNILLVDSAINLIATAILYCEIWNENMKNGYNVEDLKLMIQQSLMLYSPVKFRTLRLAMNIVGAPDDLIECFNNIQEYNGFAGGWMDILLYHKDDNEYMQYDIEELILSFEETIRKQFFPYTRNKAEHFKKNSEDVMYDDFNILVGEFCNLDLRELDNSMVGINNLVNEYSDDTSTFDKFGYDSKFFQKYFSGYSVYHSLVVSALYKPKYVKGL